MGFFVMTDKLDNIALILRKDVDMVVVRRRPSAGLDKTIGDFNVKSLNRKKISGQNRGSRYIDGNRLFLSEHDRETKEILAPVWEERRRLCAAFKKALGGAKVGMTHLFIQPAIRRKSRDYTFHRDYATGFASEEERRMNEVIFMTVAHKGFGSEAIPAKDAGRPTPFTKDNRASFHRPRSLKNIFKAETHDILVMKSGVKGTVHRSPHRRGKGQRWWTFYSTEPVSEIRKNMRGKKPARNP